MSRTIADLLGAKEPVFSTTIRSLEATSGHPGEDIRFSTQINAKVQHKIKELGLDPQDSTSKEIYHGLQSLIKMHDEYLSRAIGVVDSQNTSEVLQRVIETIEKLNIPISCWALKPSVAKRLIKTTPPKKLMKLLGYKSVDSLLKRENIADIYGVIYLIESSNWIDGFTKHYFRLKPSDFEKRKIEIRMLSQKRWSQISNILAVERGQNIITVKELGTVVIIPLANARWRGLTTTLMSLIIDAINQIRSSGSYIKLQQVKPRFGRSVQEVFQTRSPIAATTNGHQVPWRSVERQFANYNQQYWPEVFDPHLQLDDITWQQAEDVMYKIEPALKFWQDLDYVGSTNSDHPVSFNLIDNAISYCNQLPYTQQSTNYMRESLWHELMARYLAYENLQDDVLRQLDDNKSKTKNISIFLEG